MQYIAEMALTIPLLILLLRAAPAVRSVSRYSTAVQCQFGSIPALYYAFDYLTRVYTDLLESGSPVVVEFMPFVCCVAYIIFVVRLSAEQRARTHLEQLQSSLNLQVNQAVREIEGLRSPSGRPGPIATTCATTCNIWTPVWRTARSTRPESISAPSTRRSRPAA